MAHYDYNKKTYKVYTLRINQNTDAEIVEHLENQGSVNSYLLNLIRDDIRKNEGEGSYEVIEQVNGINHKIASFDSLENARDFLEYYVMTFPAGFPVRIARNYERILHGRRVTAGEIVGEITGVERIETEKEMEEENNA